MRSLFLFLVHFASLSNKLDCIRVDTLKVGIGLEIVS